MSETSLKRNCDTCVFCEFWDVFKITFLIEHLQTTTSDNTTKHDTTQIKGQRKKFNCKIGYPLGKRNLSITQKASFES